MTRRSVLMNDLTTSAGSIFNPYFCNTFFPNPIREHTSLLTPLVNETPHEPRCWYKNTIPKGTIHSWLVFPIANGNHTIIL